MSYSEWTTEKEIAIIIAKDFLGEVETKYTKEFGFQYRAKWIERS